MGSKSERNYNPGVRKRTILTKIHKEKEGVFYVEKQVLLTQSLGTADINNVRSFFFLIKSIFY